MKLTSEEIKFLIAALEQKKDEQQSVKIQQKLQDYYNRLHR